MRTFALVAVGVAMVAIAAVLLGARPAQEMLPLVPPQTSAPAQPAVAAHTQPSQAPTKESTRTPYTNTDYHYSLSYTGTLGFDYSTPAVELLYITIDPKADPIHLCAADNPSRWTAVQLFDGWRQKPPTKKGADFPCADYPAYARVSGSEITVGGRPAYQVISFRGTYEAVCSYFASAETLLAVCLPSEDVNKSTAWQEHLRVYKQIVASVKISE
jgi:hypothetical protein